jgi:thiamine biosynthesis lipoprotein
MRTVIFICLFVFCVSATSAQVKATTKVLLLMGSRFEVTAVSDNDTLSWKAINACIGETRRIEKLISEWDSTSQTTNINRNAGIKPVKIDKELYDLIYRSIKISKLTDGAFDISFAPLLKVWKLDGTIKSLPAKEEIQQAKDKVGYQKIILDGKEQTVLLSKKGMKIGFGGIGQGYVANRCMQVMKAFGIQSGLINVSGDIITWGTQPDGTAWRVGIADPSNKSSIISWLSIKDASLVTSGNYEKFITINGIRYGHILDPRTGYPVQGVGSVTIMSPDAEICDALATGIFVLGVEKGLELINKLKGIECLIIDEKGKLYPSSNMKLNYIAPNR